MSVEYEKYLRMDKFPHYWCPGCGNGIVLKSFIHAVDDIGWKNDDMGMVTGIGCSSRASGYVDFNTLHTLHGRAFAFATGLKMSNPDKHVVIIAGDGDSSAIGGNHLIHACRRNIDITLILINNWIYGMTGGQYSPTTPFGTKAATMPYGNVDPAFDLAKLTIGAGATFVARSSVAEPILLRNMIKKAMLHKGFSVIEAMSNCHIQWGRRNKFGDPVKLVNHIKDITISKGKAGRMTPEETKDLFVTGILYESKDAVEYTDSYFGMSKRVSHKEGK